MQVKRAGQPARLVVVAAVVLFLASRAIQAGLSYGSAHVQTRAGFWLVSITLLPSVAIGTLVWRRVPSNSVGPALAWLGAAPAVVLAVEGWGTTYTTPHPWPGSTTMFVLKQGFWVWNLAGFAALCLVFPDGLPTGKWRRLPWAGVIAALLVNASVSLDPQSHTIKNVNQGGFAIHLPHAVEVPILILAFGSFLAILAATVASIVVRYRRAGEVVRQQLRWLILSAGLVPILLGVGWIAEIFGAPVSYWGAAFMLVMLLAVPVAVAIAILRYDLYDVDRLLGSSLAWLLTTAISAGIFAAVVFGIGDALGADSRVSTTGAGFVTALVLLPLQRILHAQVGRLVDRERAVMFARVDEFVAKVRDGEVDPEEVETLLRTLLSDDGLRLLLQLPGESTYVDIVGQTAAVDSEYQVPLRTGTTQVGVISLTNGSRRRIRQCSELAVRARLPIEMARLRSELRRAVAEVSASRSRLLVASTTERRRLEQDLHDGAQQQIVAVGMRLRSLQGRLDPALPEYGEVDAAVDALGATVRELRSLAHGLRPARLQDGLASGLRELVRDSPVPVDLTVPELDLPEAVLTTIYFIVAETLANALKHAQAQAIQIRVAQQGASVLVSICDDGVGGARPGFGITSIHDRVSALGGSLDLVSPAGAGTSISVTI